MGPFKGAGGGGVKGGEGGVKGAAAVCGVFINNLFVGDSCYFIFLFHLH